MRIRVKKISPIREVTRTDVEGTIDDVVMHEDFVDPKKRNVEVFFKGREGSGILNFSYEEFNGLMKYITPSLKLVKKSKVIKEK
ncbi:hypothetical protein HYW75_03260 [Candidatus Pacearchaeota archaeon]|nr:hypothetical protein [Candidatus Pacearchaeota archaeon]